MPTIREDLRAMTIYAQDNGCFVSFFNAKCAITVELDWIRGNNCARDILIQVFLGILNCRFRCHDHVTPCNKAILPELVCAILPIQNSAILR